MRRTLVKLTKSELKRLDHDFPTSRSSSANVGRRAIEIVKLHYSRKKGARWVEAPKGADLAFKLSNRENPDILEVKGTADSELAFGKLKVSGRLSHDLVVEKKSRLLRVVNVFKAQPEIVELVHDKDFKLDREPRWRVRPTSSNKALQGTRRKAARP